MYKVNADARTHDVHEAIAKEWGGCLTSIAGQGEMDHLRSLFKGKFMTGARCQGTSSEPGAPPWLWSDGTPWAYTQWSPGEPSSKTAVGGARVVVVQLSGYWADRSTDQRAAAIYKRPLPKFEYKLSMEAHSYAVHAAIAQEWGGCISSISDLAELQHLRSLMQENGIFTGARCRVDENEPGAPFWQWEDGTKWDFTSWGGGEPRFIATGDTIGRAEAETNRVVMHDTGLWVVCKASDRLAAIYKRDRRDGPHSSTTQVGATVSTPTVDKVRTTPSSLVRRIRLLGPKTGSTISQTVDVQLNITPRSGPIFPQRLMQPFERVKGTVAKMEPEIAGLAGEVLELGLQAQRLASARRQKKQMAIAAAACVDDAKRSGTDAEDITVVVASTTDSISNSSTAPVLGDLAPVAGEGPEVEGQG
jgi:hypothetical protein